MSKLKLHPLPLPKVSQDAKPFAKVTERKYTRFMKKSGGIGLAAPQVGRVQRWCIVGDTFAYNPRIIEYKGEVVTKQEGCLSIPGRSYNVPRHNQIEVHYYTTGGRKMIEKAFGNRARVWQHEVDHLEGKLISDRGEEINE